VEGVIFLERALLVFLATLTADICWARYTGHAANGERWAAAWWGAGIYAFGAFTVVVYTADHWMVVPAVLGAFVGTAVGVKPKV
jgi:hypothetical protein